MSKIIFAHPRLFLSLAVGLCAFLLMPDQLPLSLRLVVAWDLGVTPYLALALFLMMQATSTSLRKRAAIEDDGRFVVLGATIVASLASLGAILALLIKISGANEPERASHVALAALTILLSWLFVHTVFALHYAHEFFALSEDASDIHRGGLDFPGTAEPDYWDFLYFSIAIGTAAATSDTNILSQRMRRLVALHSIVAFFFNTAIVGLSVNIAASLAR